MLLRRRNGKTDFHRDAWRGLWCAWPETAGRWRNRYGGVACPNFSLFEWCLDGVDRTRWSWAAEEKRLPYTCRSSNVLTACSGSGSVDDVIVMAWVGARILRGSNALCHDKTFEPFFSRVLFLAVFWVLFELRRSIANVQYTEFLTHIKGDWQVRSCLGPPVEVIIQLNNSYSSLKVHEVVILR